MYSSFCQDDENELIGGTLIRSKITVLKLLISHGSLQLVLELRGDGYKGLKSGAPYRSQPGRGEALLRTEEDQSPVSAGLESAEHSIIGIECLSGIAITRVLAKCNVINRWRRRELHTLRAPALHHMWFMKTLSEYGGDSYPSGQVAEILTLDSIMSQEES